MAAHAASARQSRSSPDLHTLTAPVEYRRMPSRRIEYVAAAAIAAASATIAAWASRPVMPPLLPAGDHATYAAAAARALALVEPVVHAPWFGAPPAAWAAAVAALIAVAFWTAARQAGSSMAATAIVFAALLTRDDLRIPLTLAAEPALAAALSWATATALAVAPGGVRALMWTSALAASSAAAWPPMLVVVPAVAVLASRTGVFLVAATVAAAVAGTMVGFVVWAGRAEALAGEPVSLLDVWVAVTASDPRGTDPFPWPAMASPVLAVALALVGAVVTAARQPPRLRVALGVAALLPPAALATLPGWRTELLRAVYWGAWPLAAVGLTWTAGLAPPRRGAWVAGGLGAVLIAGGVAASLRHLEDDERRAFARVFGDALTAATGGRGATMVTEDTRIDTAMVGWGGADWRRVRPVPALVEAAIGQDRLLLAGPSGQRALELWGFQFTPVVAVAEPVPYGMARITGRLRCLPVARPWRELPGLEYTGRLGLHVPRGTGTLDVMVLGPPPLDVRLVGPDGRTVGRPSPVAMSLTALPPVLWPGDGGLPDPAMVGTRIEWPARGDVEQSANLALGQRAPLVAVRFTEPADSVGVATVCAAPFPRDAGAVEAGVALDDDAYFAGGWHDAERAGDMPFRWAARRAVTLLPSASGGVVVVTLTARPAAPAQPGPVRLTMTLNGWTAGGRDLDAADREYRWPVPDGVWVAGTNELRLEVSETVRPSDAGSHDARELGLLVSALRILRQ